MRAADRTRQIALTATTRFSRQRQCCREARGYPKPMLEFISIPPRSRTWPFADLEATVSHRAAALPLLAARIGGFVGAMPRCAGEGSPPADVIGSLGRFWYDRTDLPVPRELVGLMMLAATDRMTYGTGRAVHSRPDGARARSRRHGPAKRGEATGYLPPQRSTAVPAARLRAGRRPVAPAKSVCGRGALGACASPLTNREDDT